jgi:hypothetical protein
LNSTSKIRPEIPVARKIKSTDQQRMASPWELDDQRSRNLAKKEMAHAHEILRPFIQFAQKLLRAAILDDSGVFDRPLAFAYRQTLEFVDGVDLLLRHHMVAPAGAQARSALEMAVQTCYLSFRVTPRIAVAYYLAQLKTKRLLIEGRMRAPNVNDVERQELSDMAAAMWDNVIAMASLHPIYAEALEQINALKGGEPWFRVFNGPRNIHDMMDRLELSPLSIYYKELNSIVHVGLPTAAIAGLNANEEPAEWLRPLRTATDWWPMPLKVAIVSADIATQAFIVHFNARHPRWLDDMLDFQKEHGERCEKAGMPDLAMSGDMRTQIVEHRATLRTQQP